MPDVYNHHAPPCVLGKTVNSNMARFSLVPLTLPLKMLLQEVSVHARGDNSSEAWDADLPEDLAKEARDKLKQMVMMKPVTFNRAWRPPGVHEDYDFLVWFDGGKPAMCAVVYASFRLLVPTQNNETKSNWLVEKFLAASHD